MTEVLLISALPRGWADARELAARLVAAGHVVRIGHAYDVGSLPPPVEGVEARRLRFGSAGRARTSAVRLAGLVGGAAARTFLYAKYDPWLRAEGRRADAVVAVDRAAVWGARQATAANQEARITAVGLAALPLVASRGGPATTLRKLLDRGMTAASPASVVAAWRAVVSTPGDAALAEFVPHAATIAQLLRRNLSFAEAREVASSALGLTLPADVRERTELELATALVSCGEPAPAELGDLVRAVLRQADAALDSGSLEVAASRVLEAVEALFNRELHADVLASPLAADPDGFLAPLRESRVFGVLGTSADRPGVSRTRTERLLIVPGDYPNFTKPIIEEFSGLPGLEVRVLDLKAKATPPRRRGQYELILDRLRFATGAAVPPPSSADAALLAWADTIFVDWCDNAAVWTTLHAPRSARIVVRFHSLEAISHQVHVIDWSRVSDVVFVADHVRALVSQAAPEVSVGPRVHVAPNAMHLERFGKPKEPGADRTIAIVGWAQRVKDPLWALDVLAALRSVDPAWNLLLVGRDFQERAHLSAMRHRDKFRSRALLDDVRDGIRYLPFTDDVPSALQAAGFVLSSSRREGFPVGVTEGAASGAVPVVRNWPMYAHYGGARGTFPPDWVVDDVDEAVKRILAHADPDVRAKEGAAARSYVVEHFDWSVILPTYQDILL